MILAKISQALTNVVGPDAKKDINSLNKKNTLYDLVHILVHLCILVIINGLFGQYLWNNVARKLFSGLSKAEWYDTFLLNLLLLFVLPNGN